MKVVDNFSAIVNKSVLSNTVIISENPMESYEQNMWTFDS